MATDVSNRQEPPLIVIVGPTASGKTSAAIEIAKLCRGEIICADSRTVYRHMDIGTAKPGLDEQRTVPHWGLDLVDPGEAFTAAMFKAYATEKIKEIRACGGTPVMVGGTGLYVDSVLFDYQFGPSPSIELREKLEAMTVEQLREYCSNNNLLLPENDKNKRHLIRLIEQGGVNQKRRDTPIDNSIVVGIATGRQELRTRIIDRTEQLFKDGVVEEATILGQKYGWNSEAMTGNIYPLLRRYVANELTIDETKQLFTTLDMRLAKRQLTWLRRNPHIVWLTRDEVATYISSLLATSQ